METLALEKRRAIHMIREELCCNLCGRVFDDPQCLDCKHNFCRECIFLHMRKTDSSCPKCKLPTRPSEITRNQFLQSILSAWKNVEQALAPLEDPNSATILAKQEQEELEESQRQQREEAAAIASRGPVASNKWTINTSELRQEADEEARRASNTALFGGSLAQRAAQKSAALDAKNAQAAASQQSMMDTSQTQMSSMLSPSPKRPKVKAAQKPKPSPSVSQVNTSSLSSLSSPFSIMGTQEVEGIMKKIQGQNRFLDEWAQSSKKKASLVQLPITGFRTAGASPVTARTVPTISAVQRVQELLASATTAGITATTRSPGKRKRQIFTVDEDSEEEEEEVEEPDDSDDDDYVEPGAGRSQTLGESPDLLGFGGVAPPVKASALGPPLGLRHRSKQEEKAKVVEKEEHEDEDEEEKDEAEDALDEDDEDDEDTAWTEPPVQSTPMKASSKRSHKRAQSPAPQTPTRASPRKRVVMPSSQQDDVVDMTLGDDEEDEEEDKDEDEEVVEDSQMPNHLAFHHNKSKRASEDFQGAIQAFHNNAPGVSPSASRFHRLSGGNDPVFDSPPAMRSVFSPSSLTKGIAAKAPQPVKPLVSAVVTPAAHPTRPPLSTTNTAHATSRRTSKSSDSPSSVFVFTSTDLTPEETKRVHIACQSLGGRFGRDFDLKRDGTSGELTTSVTHLVSKSIPSQKNLGLRCKRTAKYMRALSEGIFVVDYSWIEASLANGQWLPEDKYEMSGDIYSDAVGKPRESRLRRQRTGSRNDIFRQFQFVLLSPLHEFDFQIDSVRKIVTTFGATVEIGDDSDDALPKVWGRTNLGIVSKVMEPEYARRLLDMYRIPIVRVTWIFDSISHLEVLPFDDYYPY